MKTLWNRLMTDECGVILSAELILILTIVVLGIVTGLAAVQQAVVYELTDLGLAFSALNQSYSTPSYFGGRKWCNGGLKSFAAGSSFFDIYDGCIGVNNGPTMMGYGGNGSSAVYSPGEINPGVDCRAIPLNCPSPATATPLPLPTAAPSTVPCVGCQPSPDAAQPTPVPQ